MKEVLTRLRETAKLERYIKKGYSYEKILKQSKIVDKCMMNEMNIRMKEKIEKDIDENIDKNIESI